MPAPKLMAKNMLFFLLLFLLLGRKSAAQHCIITTFGGPDKAPDSALTIVSRDLLTGGNELALKINTDRKTIVRISSVSLLEIDGFSFLVSPEDSINVGYDPSLKLHTVTGGRYPGNYRIYEKVLSVKMPLGKYNRHEDNYNDYVRAVDSVSRLRSAILSEARGSAMVSPDVYRYMTSLIKFSHIHGLLSAQSSPTLLKLFPKTESAFASELSINDFKTDEYVTQLMYALAAADYINIVSKISDSSDYRYHAVNFVIDNFEGISRSCLLHCLLINFSFAKKIGENRLSPLYDRIKKLNLPDKYGRPIDVQCARLKAEGKAINTAVLLGSQLRPLHGPPIPASAILDSLKGKEILVDLWASWCVPCIASLPHTREIEARHQDDGFVVLYISMDTDTTRWKAAIEKNGMGKHQYLLSDSFNSLLAAYLLVSSLPRYLLISPSGIIANVDAPAPDGKNY